MKVCSLKKEKTKKLRTSASIQTETQINGCLHYAIPCAYFYVCVLLLRWWPCLHEVVCAEYARRPKKNELFL
ncbi:hypothetical protein TCDM_12600 [Trypanosoma cruzi Dm28c]|uniref:Uncharacterized protein n=1 Tax=Trypanosoma cruzi Dm28c TaxID=1416333 RepID=V5CKJ2_TRYCR|nr:hypothetical protein TCDM_12600 [Trypanosoma cruzi Dm28c]